MKLAEALTERADLQKRVSQLENRLTNVAKVQEGDQPAEKPAALMDELSQDLSRLEELIFAINRTNMLTTAPDGETLTRKIARKDVLSLRLGIMRKVQQELTAKNDRYSRNEIKYVRTIDAEDFQRQIDSLSKQLRETDIQIQQLNWLTDLMP